MNTFSLTEMFGKAVVINVNYKLTMVLFLAVAILIGAPMVSAKSNYLSSFNNYYDTSSTKLDTCNTCHGSSSGGSFNTYGVAYSKNGRNLASIEGLDSDQDGFTNIEEIKALTFPGDANDHPQTTSTTTTNVTQQQQTTAISDDDDDIEEELEDEKVSDDDIKEQLTTSVPASNVTEEKPTTEEPVNNTDETPKSPGFEAIFAVIGFITIAGLRRK
jgi:hypothetical protein